MGPAGPGGGRHGVPGAQLPARGPAPARPVGPAARRRLTALRRRLVGDEPWEELRARATRLRAVLREPAPAGAAPAYRLLIRAEQAPNPASRVTLGSSQDAFGQPRARLDWRLTPLDAHSIRRTRDLLAAEVARAGLGRVRVTLEVDPGRWPGLLRGGNHHMGTTRMHPDPACGVVDADGRVHGTANLFVAGSSVFPTGGHANPTLTLVALALRLADHVQALLR